MMRLYKKTGLFPCSQKETGNSVKALGVILKWHQHLRKEQLLRRCNKRRETRIT